MEIQHTGKRLEDIVDKILPYLSDPSVPIKLKQSALLVNLWGAFYLGREVDCMEVLNSHEHKTF